MSVTGDIVEVRVQPRGSQLVGDHTSGVSSIVVANPTDFDTAGGMLRLDGTVYTWTSVTLNGTDDEATATLAITPNLGANEPDTMPVELWSGAQVIDDVVLTVDAGGDTPAYVSLRSDQRKDWTALEGYLEPPVPATFSDDFSVLLDADGYTPSLDVSSALGLPEPATIAVAAPTTTPTLLVTGFPTSVMAAVTNQPDSPSMVRFYISTSNASPMDSTTALPDSREFVKTITALKDGTPLVLGTTYYVAAAFTNNQGTGPATAWKSASLNTEMIEQIAAQVATLGAIITGQISVGLGYWNPNDGLVLPGPDGSQTKFPVDGVTPAQIAGYLIALSMTVNNGMNVYGASRFYGTSTLANGVGDPTTKATVSPAWSSLATDLGSSSGFGQFRHGLTQATDSTKWLTATAFFGGNLTTIVKTTGLGANVSGGAGTWGDGYNPFGGVVRIGANFYTLGQDANRSGQWWVYVFDSTYAKTGEWQWTDTDGANGDPAIGSDGTNVVIVQSVRASQTTFTANVRTYTTAGASTSGGLTGAANVAITAPTLASFGGVFVGAADFGATRIVLATESGYIYAFTAAGVPASTHSWTSAGGTKINGFYWDAARFRHIDNNGFIWDYNTNATDTTPDIAFAWMDNDTSSGSTAHETRAEPTRASVTWKRRTLLAITGQPAPEVSVTDPTKRDKANLLRFYATATTGGTLYAQSIGTLGQLTSTGAATLATTTAAQTTNQFIGIVGSVGTLVSAGGKTSFGGDDVYALNGTWTLETSGTLTAITGLAVSYRVVNGKVRVKCSTTGTPTIATGTTTVATGQLPLAIRPATIETGSAVCQGQAATLRVNTDGTVSVIQNNAASRNTCDGNVEYDRP